MQLFAMAQSTLSLPENTHQPVVIIKSGKSIKQMLQRYQNVFTVTTYTPSLPHPRAAATTCSAINDKHVDPSFRLCCVSTEVVIIMIHSTVINYVITVDLTDCLLLLLLAPCTFSSPALHSSWHHS